MEQRCPGRDGTRELASAMVHCPFCGRDVEFFSDEPTRWCKCGHRLVREEGLQCAEWCPAAEQCLGAIGAIAKKKPPSRADRPEQATTHTASGPKQPPSLAPPPQQNIRDAVDKAVRELHGQTREQLAWLGAEHVDEHTVRIPVLDADLDVNLCTGAVTAAAGRPVRPYWRVLLLHYAALRARPAELPPTISFAELPVGRTYAPVYEGRVLRRLCVRAGRDLESLNAAAARLGARAVAGDEVTFDVKVLPRIAMRLVWYAPDDEFPPSAVLLMPKNIETFFHVEDIIVLSEGIVSRFNDKPFEEDEP
jgi:hypothetical protein